MFTGIVQELGKIIQCGKKGDSIKFTVKPAAKNYLKDISAGESISINGACMTVEKIHSGNFDFTTVNESLSKTNLGSLRINDYVNLEKAMKLDSRLDGHIVQGHVDTTGIVKNIIPLKDSWEFFFEFNSKFRDNIIYVGSIAINGVSLTVAEIVKETKKSILIKTAIIPHTIKVTNFKYFKKNDLVNIEFDMMGKYVKRIISGSSNEK